MVSVPALLQVEVPIQVLMLHAGAGAVSTASYPCLRGSLAPGSSLRLKESHASVGGGAGAGPGTEAVCLTVGLTQIEVGRGAALHHSHTQETDGQWKHSCVCVCVIPSLQPSPWPCVRCVCQGRCVLWVWWRPRWLGRDGTMCWRCRAVGGSVV